MHEVGDPAPDGGADVADDAHDAAVPLTPQRGCLRMKYSRGGSNRIGVNKTSANICAIDIMDFRFPNCVDLPECDCSDSGR